MATHSSILAWRIPWTEESGGLQSMGSQESDTTKWLHFLSFSLSSHNTNAWMQSQGQRRRRWGDEAQKRHPKDSSCRAGDIS